MTTNTTPGTSSQPKTEPRMYGYWCYCRDHESPGGNTSHEVELAAMVAGWKIGLAEGQAHYAHPDCAHGLHDLNDLCPSEWWRAGKRRSHGRTMKVSGETQLRDELFAGEWYAKAQ